MSIKSEEDKSKLQSFTVNSANYRGPLDKLLELVEEEDMDIELVSLAKVTSGFLDYLAGLKDKNASHRIIAEFLVVASKLLLIKSKVLVPALDLDEEEEEDIADLQLQLKLYKAIKDAKGNIENSWSVAPRSRTREFLMIKETFFYPPKNVSVDKMYDALQGVVKEVEKLLPAETIEKDMISLESKVEEIISLINSQDSLQLSQTHGDGTKGDLVALFLAVLHLFKDEMIHAEQEGHFREIHVKKQNNRSNGITK